ncbi:prostaglandin E2 receptor EP4 subtype-like [Saccostrea cucullata]|uniref:prostaglandin E2 receptor EP4 subtype-like n=1 Tax=Saccostrea cuccullata TaxID=36930 RepID=UPI002ED3DB6A
MPSTPDLDIKRSNFLSVQHSNSSSDLVESPSIAPHVVLCLLGVAGNGIAVIIVCCSVKQHQWRPFYRFVFGLAVTDGFGVMLALPFAIVRYATHFEYSYSQTVCDYMAVIQMFTIMASAMIVCTMSLERFFALIFPYKFQYLTKEARSIVILICIWVVSAFLSSGHLMAGRPSKRFYPDSWCFVNFESQEATDRGFSYLYVLNKHTRKTRDDHFLWKKFYCNVNLPLYAGYPSLLRRHTFIAAMSSTSEFKDLYCSSDLF